jgi:hypothetical protein
MAKGGQPVTTFSSTESSSGPWEPQQPYILRGFEQAAKLYGRGVPDYYPDPTVAGFDPAQQFAQEATIDYARGPRAAGQQAAAESALIKGLSGRIDPSAYNPMVDALTGNVIGNLQENILPGIRQQQVMYQPGGSSRAALEQNKAVTSAVQQGLTKPLADMYTNAYNLAQDRMSNFANLYPSIMAAPLSMYGAIGQVGDARQAMTQRAIDADIARYNYEQNAEQNALNNYMASITGNYGSVGSSSTETTRPGPSGLDTFGQILDVGSKAASLFKILSDRSMKENIVPEGTKWKGLNVYSFNYIGDSRKRRGVMAQEVEVIRPDAISNIGGIKYVNYGVL